MNILILNYRDIKHPLAGGAEVHLHRIFGKLASWGHRIVLATTQFKGGAPRESLDGIEVIRFGGDLLFQAHVLIRWKSLMREFKPDLILEDLNKLPFFTPLFSRVPKLIQIHHLWRTSIFEEAPAPVAFLVWLEERLIPWIYPGNPFIAVSPSTVHELIQLGIPSADIRLIYNGCEQEWAELEPQRIKSNYFLWLGRLRRYKGVFVALEAFKRFAQKNPHIELKIAGDGPDAENIRNSIKEMKLQDRVHLLGRVSAEEKRSLMRNALALIQSSYKEGWGLTVIEAAVCGTTSIASNVPGLCDSVKDGETGLLFPAGDSLSLATCMDQLVKDEALRQRLESGARQWSMEFSWEKAASQTLDAAQAAIARPRRLP